MKRILLLLFLVLLLVGVAEARDRDRDSDRGGTICPIPGGNARAYGITDTTGLLGIYDPQNYADTSALKDGLFSTNNLDLQQATAGNQPTTPVVSGYKVWDFDGDDYLQQEEIDDETGMTLLPTAALYDLTDAGAAMQLPSASLATASGSRTHVAVWKDSTPKVIAYGYIGEVDAAESLGLEIIGAVNFTSGWTASTTATINDADTFTTTAAGNCYKADILEVGALYRVVVLFSTTAASVGVGSINDAISASSTVVITSGVTAYFVAAYDNFTIRNSSAGETSVTSITLKKVTNLGTSAAHIYSTVSGVTRGWTYKDATATINTPATLEVYKSDWAMTGDQTHILIVKPDDGQPASASMLVSKSTNVAGNKALIFYILSTGVLRLELSEDGTNAETVVTDSAQFSNGAQTSFKLVAFAVNKTSGSAAIYVNGESKPITSTITSGSAYDSHAGLMVGATGAGSYFFSGQISLYISFSRVLSAGEITAIYNSCVVRKKLAQ